MCLTLSANPCGLHLILHSMAITSDARGIDLDIHPRMQRVAAALERRPAPQRYAD